MSTLTLMVVVGTSACSSQGPVSAGKDIVAVDPNATIQEFMAGQVDPAADALWDSVAIIVSVLILIGYAGWTWYDDHFGTAATVNGTSTTCASNGGSPRTRSRATRAISPG